MSHTENTSALASSNGDEKKGQVCQNIKQHKITTKTMKTKTDNRTAVLHCDKQTER